MKAALRSFSLGPGRGSGLGLMLLLSLVVLAPSTCLLWVMNQAVRNERLAARQKLADAYRAHLLLAQERLESVWREQRNALEAQAQSLPPPVFFAKQVRDGLADAVICFDASSNVVYPNRVSPSAPIESPAGWAEVELLERGDPTAAAAAFAGLARAATNTTQAARALQAQARCLVRAQDKPAALAVLIGPLAEERFRTATDAQGRPLVPNAQLMALELMRDSAPDQAHALLGQLTQWLQAYDDASLAAPQRRFLMHELARLFPDQAAFPTLAAEDLAAAFLEAGTVRPADSVLRPTPLPDVWQLATPGGRVVLLHRTQNLQPRLRASIAAQSLPADVTLAFLPPGREAEKSLLSVPAGPSFPGWRVALGLNEQNLFKEAAEQRIASYLWISLLVVATVVALALVALRLVERQLALTRLRNDLVANVTHELKTPLSSMRLLVDTLLNSRQLEETTTREYLQLIARENLRLSRLIDNFLTFSRMERKKHAFEFKPVPVSRIVEGAVAAAGERLNTPGCRFDLQLAPDLPPVVADADAIVTALVNLLDNAYKYSGDEKVITLSARAGNGRLAFAVKDNGIGLAPRETRRIFKRFYQVDRRLSRTGGGCGLGLSIVEFIVKAHHGTVQVESDPGRGSTFTISLPIAESTADTSQTGKASLPSSAGAGGGLLPSSGGAAGGFQGEIKTEAQMEKKL